MARGQLAFGCLILLSCSHQSDAERAEKQFAIVEQNGSASDRCEAARAAQQAWLKELNQAKFNEWKARADGICLRVSIERGLGM
jgi:hypothetical protein